MLFYQICVIIFAAGTFLLFAVDRVLYWIYKLDKNKNDYEEISEGD